MRNVRIAGLGVWESRGLWFMKVYSTVHTSFQGASGSLTQRFLKVQGLGLGQDSGRNGVAKTSVGFRFSGFGV